MKPEPPIRVVLEVDEREFVAERQTNPEMRLPLFVKKDVVFGVSLFHSGDNGYTNINTPFKNKLRSHDALAPEQITAPIDAIDKAFVIKYDGKIERHVRGDLFCY